MSDAPALIKRAAVVQPQRSRRIVDVPALGGAVQVVGLTLSERLAFVDGLRGPDSEDARRMSVAQLLALTVRDADDEPVMSLDDWDVWLGEAADDEWRELAEASRIAGGLNREHAEGESEAAQS